MEIELKLALLPRYAMRLRRHPLLNQIKPDRRVLLSIYFDTSKFDLMRRGIALRVRRVDHHWVQTLKSASRAVGALSSRPEWEMAVADGDRPDFSVLPQAALDLLAGIKLKHIAPVFTTEFQRTTWQIGSDEAQAELALDIGKICAGEKCQDICEVEIERKSGALELLFHVAIKLLEQIPLHIEPRSKAERGYILSDAFNPAPVKASRAAIHKNQTAGEVWNTVMQTALVPLVANVPGFLEHAHDTEYLHQLRIALRRLGTGVVLAKALGQGVPDWDRSLHELLHALNSARDWDVFLHETLPGILVALGKGSGNAPVEDATLDLLRCVAARTRQRAQALLLKPVFTRLVLDLGRSLLVPPDDTQVLEAKVWADKILEKRWHILRKRCRSFAGLGPIERHQARITAKKMRYAADVLAPLYGKRSNHFIAALTAMQNDMGHENDLHVGVQLLSVLPKKSARISYDLGRISGALEFEAMQHAHSSNTTWRRLARSRLFWR